MVIDTSALLAILFHEPEWKRMAQALNLDPYRVVSCRPLPYSSRASSYWRASDLTVLMS